MGFEDEDEDEGAAAAAGHTLLGLLHPEPSKLALAFAMDALVQWHESCSAVRSQIARDKRSGN